MFRCVRIYTLSHDEYYKIQYLFVWIIIFEHFGFLRQLIDDGTFVWNLMYDP